MTHHIVVFWVVIPRRWIHTFQRNNLPPFSGSNYAVHLIYPVRGSYWPGPSSISSPLHVERRELFPCCLPQTTLFEPEGGCRIFLRNLISTYNSTRCHSPEDHNLSFSIPSLSARSCQCDLFKGKIFWNVTLFDIKVNNSSVKCGLFNIARSSGKNWSPSFLDTARTTLKTTRPTIVLLLRVYSLPRWRFYLAVA
jgi:hypothetical protein